MKQYHWLIILIIVLALTACGGSAARLNNQGNQNFEAKNFDDALKNYTAAQQEDPNLTAPYYNAGNARYRQNDLKGAAAQLQQAGRAADEKVAPSAAYNLGNTYFRGQDLPKAIDAYKQALRLNPNDADAKHNLELALQQQQQQQSQQQQQQGGGGQQQKPPQDNQQQGGGQGGQQPNQGGGQGQQPQPSGGQGGMTRQQAEQMLDTLEQNSKTLQDRLQQQVGGGAPPAGKDW
jgi:Ca-activated chloride channel family protein